MALKADRLNFLEYFYSHAREIVSPEQGASIIKEFEQTTGLRVVEYLRGLYVPEVPDGN